MFSARYNLDTRISFGWISKLEMTRIIPRPRKRAALMNKWKSPRFIKSILIINFVPHHLRHCATSRKVAGSIPDGVIRILHWHNPSGRTMALGSTQPLTEMSTTNISWWGKGGRCVGLTTLLPSCADCLEIWEPQPPGTLRVCLDL